ncbi:protein-L-isoaspartate(D-aspartate) O-methyltransferase [Robiginitalea aurantiaca]|uniref:Protein-L-isoaspartate O-methyltransferase n=1 Tax=Robiginitalea aurantiaca TaxID=3056915 RepID=A0ABT7WFP1_9FLAO|nr:protein-L-isoaspartate(D-aspartate) O-methyltransferase [Robiginitalea aurantiaca]MDM9631723.1 protein-L-isoaspartate(D-aspartate) O-methyltransferase [Robiginitalea aurantiaca]
MQKAAVLLLICLMFLQEGFAQQDYTALREVMVREQLEARDISDSSVLAVMRRIPRHEFVPEDYKDLAYNDRALPIGEGQTISQPYIVAYMTQVLGVQEGEKVLEIGTGSGYQAAILSELGGEVYTIEIVEPLGMAAKRRLKALGYRNVTLRIGDGYNGWPEVAPFDAIMVTAGAETLPQPLMEQLADGGRMVIPIGPHGGVRQLTLITRKNGKFKSEKLMAVRFVPFVRQSGKP